MRELIIKHSGDLPRIELFAREKVEGWSAWGKEILSDVEIKLQQENTASPAEKHSFPE